MLILNTVKLNNGSREEIIACLQLLSSNDNDFNGENGLEYCWEETIKNGFTSNMDFLLDELKDIESDEEFISSFFENWIGRDNYYEDYESDIIFNENGKVEVIALAYI